MKAARECGLCGRLVYSSEWAKDADACIPCVADARKRSADPVNPPYYKRNGLELIDVIKAWNLHKDGLVMQAVQYLFRADLKGDRKENLEKAKWYIEKAIEWSN